MRRASQRRRPRVALVAVVVGVLCAVSVAVAALAPGRKPVPTNASFDGVFHRALWAGNITLTLTEDGSAIARVTGILPANCRDRRNGRLRRNGPDGAIGIVFDLTGGPIADDGSFAFSARNDSLGAGLAPGTLTITGTFYGNNALGRLRGTTGREFIYSSCTGNQPFWVRRSEASDPFLP